MAVSFKRLTRHRLRVGCTRDRAGRDRQTDRQSQRQAEADRGKGCVGEVYGGQRCASDGHAVGSGGRRRRHRRLLLSLGSQQTLRITAKHGVPMFHCLAGSPSRRPAVSLPDSDFVSVCAQGGSGASSERYMARGVSAAKEDVHAAIAKVDKGLFPHAFCKVVPDIAGDPDWCTCMHADGAGTKSSLAYMYTPLTPLTLALSLSRSLALSLARSLSLSLSLALALSLSRARSRTLTFPGV